MLIKCYGFDDKMKSKALTSIRAIWRSLRMAKNEMTFFCTECGAEHVKWVGRCTSCKEWNTVKEFRTPNSKSLDALDIRAAGANRKKNALGGSAPWLPTGGPGGLEGSMVAMKDVKLDYNAQTLPIFSSEVNRVLGGGIVKGSVVLLAGEPGIGKSTLLLQLAASIVENCKGHSILIGGRK